MLCRNQALKPSRTSTPKSKNIRSKIIQTICLDPKVCWNQAQKPLETSTNHKLVKLYEFKPLKPQRTSNTNLRRQKTHEEHEEREEQRISNKLIARDSSWVRFKDLQSIPQPSWRISCVRVKITLLQIQSISLLRRSN